MAKTKHIFKVPDYSLLKLDSKTYTKDYRNAIWYLHYEASAATLKSATLKWIKNNTSYDVKDLSSLSDSDFSIIGKYCTILNAGGQLPSHANFVESHIEKIFQSIKKEEITEIVEEPEPKIEHDSCKVKKISIQDRIKSQAYKACGEIEGLIDQFYSNPSEFVVSQQEIESLFKKSEIKSHHVKYITEIYSTNKKELEELSAGKSEQLNEGYNFLTKRDINKAIKLFNLIIETASSSKIVTVKKRAKKQKPLDISKLVKSFKYLEKSTDLNLESINPVHIVGAKEVWVFNTKSRKLGKYIALDTTGLSIKGTTITNFSEKSIEKTIRKPEEYFKNIKKISKKAKEKLFVDTKSVETKLKGRTNEHCIILEVIK
ncbi:hypothetical protein RVBP16_2950 [Pseudomonas phage sp. 30-2]|nr:hypothetical protein RVBP16_2950 [Pseudomonas phage sp. 30-2]